eukprot:TRINITY_DN7142_c0_g2_i1.p1 TRINITY_DN7142_c0_g2~~TRINITY_DN7142_c0_g2_i1.p1  ORF type:complete len:222 (+),score=48.27 TRINITY_DN7142_c0_g2_i1:47-667(+)
MKVVHTFGVATSRYVSLLPVCDEHNNGKGEFFLDTALSTGVARWDVLNNHRVFFKVLHQTAVTGLLETTLDGRKLIFTISYGGEVSSWDAEWNLLGHVTTSVGVLLHVALDTTSTPRLVISSEDGMGLATIIRIGTDSKGESSSSSSAPLKFGELVIEKEIQGNYNFCEFSHDGQYSVAIVQPQHRHTRNPWHGKNQDTTTDSPST